MTEPRSKVTLWSRIVAIPLGLLLVAYAIVSVWAEFASGSTIGGAVFGTMFLLHGTGRLMIKPRPGGWTWIRIVAIALGLLMLGIAVVTVIAKRATGATIGAAVGGTLFLLYSLGRIR